MLLFILTLMLFLTALRATTNNVDIEYGSSVKFSDAEIKSAIDIALADFVSTKTYKGCDLTRLWYDEAESNQIVENYMTNGRGLFNGIEKENVIAIQAHFNVGEKANIYFNPPSTVTNWHWNLIRNSATDMWVIDGAGWTVVKVDALCAPNKKAVKIAAMEILYESPHIHSPFTQCNRQCRYKG